MFLDVGFDVVTAETLKGKVFWVVPRRGPDVSGEHTSHIFKVDKQTKQ
jgi:hypothetical protein